jgi:hypothetical protein
MCNTHSVVLSDPVIDIGGKDYMGFGHKNKYYVLMFLGNWGIIN